MLLVLCPDAVGCAFSARMLAGEGPHLHTSVGLSSGFPCRTFCTILSLFEGNYFTRSDG